MKKEILKYLDELERKEEIKILLAVESGSRGWGCPSLDSDYDVRILFVRPITSYLSVTRSTEDLNYFHGKLMDINGWDVRKAFGLIRKSNATPFEWAQSPIVYLERNDFSKTVLDLCRKYFRPYHSVNHYRGIAKNSYIIDPLTGTLKLKKLFYVLRPLLAAKWILDKKTVPPMDLPNLMTQISDKKIVDRIHELLAFKTTTNEDYVHTLEPLLVNYIAELFKVVETVKLTAPKDMMDPEELDKIFRNLILSV
jgi:Predicted nucleotidyltransferase